MKDYLVLLQLLCLGRCANSWGEKNNKMKLQDVQVLTLHQGKMTTGRRSSPVPQLNCVGGSAKGLFNPQVVQCYNRGWDGMDVQWECKTDLDMEYRLGSVNVLCEGYDYPDDPFILTGSCGLEYTLELTQAGREKQKSSNSYSSSNYGHHYTSDGYQEKYGESRWKGLGDLIILGVVAIVIYAVYKTCIDTQEMGDRQYSSTGSDGYPGGSGGSGSGGGWTNPNTGHRGNYGTGGGYDDGNCGAGGGARRRGTGAGGMGGGNFWPGLGVGGLLGYMFGARNNTGYGGYNRGYNNYATGGGWGGGSAFSGGHSRPSYGSFGGGSSPSSGGTRTASGFGGTTRR